MEERLLRDLERDEGISGPLVALSGGWLNRLWRCGDLLIKQYSPQRFSLRQLGEIELALQRQDAVRRLGVPTPRIHPKDGRMLRWLDEHTAYVVMDYCGGHNEQPQTINLSQMRDLGAQCALIHRALGSLPVSGVKGYAAPSTVWMDALQAHVKKTLETPENTDCAEYREAVLKMAEIARSLPQDFLSDLPRGIAHEDFTPDNLLFDASGVTAIIDFDRNQYSLPWHDIGRALLSFALVDGRLDRKRVHAFVDGYSHHIPFDRPLDALRAAWCMEAPWWIQPGCFVMEPCKATRYRDEIVWAMKNWNTLL